MAALADVVQLPTRSSIGSAPPVRTIGRTVSYANRRINIAPEHRRAGVVFQEPRLFPHLSVRRNLLYGAGGPGALAEITARLDIAHLLDRWPRTLSGGEARRVAQHRKCAPSLPFFKSLFLDTDL